VAARGGLVKAIEGLARAREAGTRRERREAAHRLAERLHEHLPKSALELVREWVRIVALALVVAFAVKHSVVEPYVVPSRSMVPTLVAGDRIMVNKCAYDVRVPFTPWRLAQVREPRRWEVIVFSTRHIPDASALPKNFVKRVVGLPGEEIEIRGGEIYADGVHVEKPPALAAWCYYLNPVEGRTTTQPLEDGRGDEREVPWRYGFAGRRFRVPEGHYFVLGDNSSESLDGRCWGFVPREDIRGRVLFHWQLAWPFYAGPVR
jgi:signal peptidase I